MKLNNEQFEALKPYEQHFLTAVRSRWSRNPGSAALDTINEIYCAVTGSKLRLNKGCNHCVLTLIADMGAIYLADKKEREQKSVAVKESLTTAPVKVEVKTKKRTTKKTRK